MSAVALCLQFKSAIKRTVDVARGLKALQNETGRSLRFLIMGEAAIPKLHVLMENLNETKA
jgi:hypothetical protein